MDKTNNKETTLKIDCPVRREYEAKFEAINRLIDIRVEYNEQALKVARCELERRLEGMNEFRQQLDRQAGTFISRPELMVEIEKLELKMSPLIRACAQNEGSRKWTDYLVMAIISGFVVWLSRLLLPH